jgi:tetratricopeptide (TPR) repeat protein
MSLIVARRFRDKFIIIGDTRITYMPIEKSTNLKEGLRDIEEGLIKSVIVNSNLCISIAGDIDYAGEALQEIGTGKGKNEVLEIVEKIHHKSRLPKSYQTDDTSFLVCFGYPIFEMYAVKDGKTEAVQVGWIGSYSAFNKYQSYFHRPSESQNAQVTHTFLKAHKLPDEFDQEKQKIYSSMLDSMHEVIEDESITDVGGFAIPIIYESNSFRYTSYVNSYRKPLDFDSEKFGVINWGGAAEGSYTLNLAGSSKAMIAIHFHQGSLGIIYKREDNKLLSPIIHSGLDEIDFADKLKAEFGMNLTFQFHHNLGFLLNKGQKEIASGNILAGVSLITRGIKISSKNWKKGSNPKPEYESLSEFSKAEKHDSIQLPHDELETLKIAFLQRGIGHHKLGEHEKAIFNFDEALLLDPNNISVLSRKWFAQYELGLLHEAIKTISSCIRIKPKNLDAFYHNRGKLYFICNDLDKAECDFKSALEINPNNNNSIQGLIETTKKRINDLNHQ